MPGTRQIEFAVGVLDGADALAAYVDQVSDPNSPLYRHYLTPEEETARFGPTVCNYQAIIDWLKAGGVTIIQTYDDRTLLEATGTAAQLDALLHITLNEYRRRDGTTFFAPDRDPSVTVGSQLSIDGLDDCVVETPL